MRPDARHRRGADVRGIAGPGVGLTSGNAGRSARSQLGASRRSGDRLGAPVRADARRSIGRDADAGAGHDLPDRGTGRFPRRRGAGDPRALPGNGRWFSTLVTGPSRTADIERVLTVGVQGPGKVMTLFVDDL